MQSRKSDDLKAASPETCLYFKWGWGEGERDNNTALVKASEN